MHFDKVMSVSSDPSDPMYEHKKYQNINYWQFGYARGVAAIYGCSTSYNYTKIETPSEEYPYRTYVTYREDITYSEGVTLGAVDIHEDPDIHVLKTYTGPKSTPSLVVKEMIDTKSKVVEISGPGLYTSHMVVAAPPGLQFPKGTIPQGGPLPPPPMPPMNIYCSIGVPQPGGIVAWKATDLDISNLQDVAVLTPNTNPTKATATGDNVSGLGTAITNVLGVSGGSTLVDARGWLYLPVGSETFHQVRDFKIVTTNINYYFQFEWTEPPAPGPGGTGP